MRPERAELVSLFQNTLNTITRIHVKYIYTYTHTHTHKRTLLCKRRVQKVEIQRS